MAAVHEAVENYQGAENPLAGCSKRSRCEAREKSTSESVLTVRCSEAIERQRSIWVFFISLLQFQGNDNAAFTHDSKPRERMQRILSPTPDTDRCRNIPYQRACRLQTNQIIERVLRRGSLSAPPWQIRPHMTWPRRIKAISPLKWRALESLNY